MTPPATVPSHPSLGDVPQLLVDELAAAHRGVLVLALDGVGHGPAAEVWHPAELTGLTSTFPSTSSTAWLTALTGAGPGEHGVAGMVYRVGGGLVYAVTGAPLAGTLGEEPLLETHRTVFERAAEAGVRCLALGRELTHLPGPWAPAVLRGCELAPCPPAAALAAQAADPEALVAAVAAGVDQALPADGRPTLLWVYVNLDDHIHRHGYDRSLLAALERIERDAERWARHGWTVISHADHGQVPCAADPELVRAWAAIDVPADCALPSGGAGRVRWLHPRPGRRDALHARLADALGDAAVVLTAAELTDRGLVSGLQRRRIGDVVAIAADERFPVPDPAYRFEHGGLHPDELVIPFAVWR